jgi:hypothetical protein
MYVRQNNKKKNFSGEGAVHPHTVPKNTYVSKYILMNFETFSRVLLYREGGLFSACTVHANTYLINFALSFSDIHI